MSTNLMQSESVAGPNVVHVVCVTEFSRLPAGDQNPFVDTLARIYRPIDYKYLMDYQNDFRWFHWSYKDLKLSE